MKESKRRRSLSGAVLIMILTVMFILIILLTATLTTVTTANQRIYTKFEENQAYYTARSALDVFTQNMMDDGEYYSAKTYSHIDKEVSPIVVKTGEKMKQGLALQFDLYKIHSQCETYGKDGSDVANLKWAENMDATNAALVFSAANMDPSGGLVGTPPEKDNFSISATALNGDSDAAKQKNYIEYQVTLPTLSDGSNSYGRFVDTDSSAKQVAKIKVEILDRVYATEPSYSKEQIRKYFDPTVSAADKTAAGCPADDATLMSAIANGSRNKDYMKIKITSTVTVLGTEGIAVVIIETTEKNTPANDQALTATGKFSGGSGAQARLLGGGATMDIGVSQVGDGNNMFGSIFSLGQLKWTSSTDTSLNKDEFMVAMGGIADSSNPTKIKAHGTGAFVLWGGTSTLNNGGTIGDSTNAVPVLAEKIIKTSATDLNFFGDVYVETFESQANNPGKTVVASGHNMYVKNLILDGSMFTVTKNDAGVPTGVTINASELSALKPKFCTGYSIKGTMWDGTQIEITSSGAKVNGTTVTLNNSLTTSSTAAFNLNTFSIEKKNEKLYRRYTNLPFSVDGKNYVDVPTAQAYFGEYFRNGAFHEETGELKDFSNQSNYNLSDPVNAYSNIYSTANKNSWLLTGADMLADYFELPEPDPTAPARTISSVLTSKAITAEVMPTGGTVDIDLSGGDKYYYLSGSYQNCKWTVKGNNGRLVLLINEDTNTGIIKADGSLDGGVGATVTFENCELITENIDTTIAGTPGIINGTTKAPRIDIYGGTGSYFKTRNNNFICGYFMMPTGYVYLENGKTNGTYTSGGVSNPANNIAVVGSVLCNEFCESNQSGVLYIDKNSGGETPGEPILTVQSSQYVRN